MSIGTGYYFHKTKRGWQYETYFLICDSCGKEVKDESEEFDFPDEAREIRKKLGWSQKENLDICPTCQPTKRTF